MGTITRVTTLGPKRISTPRNTAATPLARDSHVGRIQPYIPADPSMLVRPTRHPGRFYAYNTVVTTTAVHFHAMAEITLVRAGDGATRIAGRQYHLAPNTLSLALPNVPHHQETDGAITKQVCMFDMALVEPLLARDQASGQLRLVGERYPAAVQLSESEGDEVAGLFDALRAEHSNPSQLGSGILVGGLLSQLLVRFLRSATAPGDAQEAEPPSAPSDDFDRVVAHVHEYFTTPINRATVAKALGMRPEAVSRAFSHAAAGGSFSAYLNGLRLGHATELLQSTNLSATEVAHLSGFDSYRTFARSFHARYGQSPSAFRGSVGAA